MAQDYKAMAGSMLSGGGMADGRFWNFSRPDQEGFTPVLEGTLVKVSFSQARNYDANQRKFTSPAFWPDGNPKLMIRLHVADANGEVWIHEVQPKSHCLSEDWLPKSPNGSIEGFLGMMLRIEAEQEVRTQDGRVIPFGSGNRRRFNVTVMGPGTVAPEGVDYESLERLQSKVQPQQQQQQPPQQQQQPPQQTPQGVSPQQFQQQVQPASYGQVPQQQPMSRVMQQAYQAAAAAGYTAQQQPGYSAAAPAPVAPQQPELYDNEIPF